VEVSVVALPSAKVVVSTWRSALLVETVPVVTLRREEVDALDEVSSESVTLLVYIP
jgi:hypothetical protein